MDERPRMARTYCAARVRVGGRFECVTLFTTLRDDYVKRGYL